MELREALTALLEAEPNVWDRYALLSEPLRGRLTPPLTTTFLELAHGCGQSLAREVRGQYPGQGPGAILEVLGVTVTLLEQSDGGEYTTFACYDEPDHVTVWQRTVRLAEEALLEADCTALLGLPEGVGLTDILLAHELYHYYEYARKDLPTSQPVLTLWRLGSWTRKSRVICLGEVGAMAFAQELLGLSFCPFLLNALLLWPQERRRAVEIVGLISRLSLEKTPPQL